MALERLSRLVRGHQDLLLAAALGAMSQVEIWSSGNRLEDKLLLAPLALAIAASLAWRRRAPVVVLGLIVGLGFLSALVVPTSGDDPLATAIALVVAIYSVGAHAEGAWAAAGALAALGVTFVVTATDPEEATLGSYLFFLFVVGGPWLAGRAIRHRRVNEERLEKEKVQAEAAIGEERSRIARELHDVVAHAISVIVLQARGGRKLVDSEPGEARVALDAIERTASQALAEMRRLLELLREGDEQLALAPPPSLSRLDLLAEQVRAAGLPVEVEVRGEPVGLPPGVDLSAYRIVQEALTNALKHAGPARSRVIVNFEPGELILEIADDGTGEGNGAGTGQGLVGIRERVSLFGGDVEAGPRTEGGYAVRVRLPYVPER